MIHLQAAHLQVAHRQAAAVTVLPHLPHLPHHHHPLEVIQVVQILKVLKNPPKDKTLKRLVPESLVLHQTQMQLQKRKRPKR